MKPVLAGLACLLLVAGGCSDSGDDKESGGAVESPAATSTTTTSEPPADAEPVGPDVTVTATEHAFAAPRVLSAGVVNLTVKNDGKLRHEALIVRIGDTDKATVIEDLNKFVDIKGRPIASYLDFNGGVSTLEKGTAGTASLTLPAGEYALVCTLTDLDSVGGAPIPEGINPPEHYSKGMYAPLTVKGDGGGTLPLGDGAVEAKDYGFQLPAFAAGARQYVFRNDGPAQPHFLSIGRFPEGVDAAAARRALEAVFTATADAPAPERTPQPVSVAFVEPLGPGAAATFNLNLEPGATYSVTCFMSDRQGGPPHVTKGMWGVFTVPT